MTDLDLDALLRQAELQQQQMKLELQFQKNMELFKQCAPEIYLEYRHYSPTRLQLNLDPQGHLNLVNLSSGTPVYSTDPEGFCRSQVERFKLKPHAFNIGFTKPEETYFFQLPILNSLMDKVGNQLSSHRPSVKKPIGVLVVNGCGIGYHISQLLETCDIYTLCIYDPHKDSFYASLHTLDWQPIVNYFLREGRTLKLFIGMNDENTISSLRLMTNKAGLHSICNTYVFTHLSSQETDLFSKSVKNQFHLLLTGTGFLEDEQVSIAHTVANLNDRRPVWNGKASETELPPAFIVGNGPSLDLLIDFLRKEQRNAVVFSCGSTTGTLFKEGIVPDFHVEMERIDSTTKRIISGATPDYLKQITLLALNTVTPHTMRLFGRALMAKKANDPGEFIVDQEYGQSHPPLELCNPTCANAGAAFALKLGFKELYLLGTDFGMRDETKHHAASSQYYAEEDKPNFASSEKRVDISVEGNFGGTLKTTAILDTARANMQIAVKNNPQAVFYNLNDGARISGARPTPVEEVVLPRLQADKRLLLEEMINTSFHQAPNSLQTVDEKRLKNKYLREFFALREQIQLPASIEDLFDLQRTMNGIHGAILNTKESAPVSYWLLSGSIQSFFALIMKACNGAANQAELDRCYAIGREHYHAFLERAYTLLRKKPLELHDINRHFTFPLDE